MKNLLFIACLASSLGFAQTADQADTKADSASQEAPAKETLDAFGKVLPGRFSYSADISFDQQYDDNVFPNNAPGKGGLLSAMSGRFSIANVGPRNVFQMHYEPSFRVSETGPDNSGGSHSFFTSLVSQRSNRTTFTTTGAVNVISSNNLPAQQFVVSGTDVLPVFSPQLVPVGTRDISPYGSFTLTHLLTRRTRVEAQLEGTANFVDAEDDITVPLSGRVLSNSYSAGTRLGMYHDVTASTSLGAFVRYRYVASEKAFEPHLHNQVIGMSVRHKFMRGWETELSAGPSFVVRQGRTITSYALNGSLGRVTTRSRVGVSYGDGIQSTAVSSFTTQRAIAGYAARELTRRWSIESTFAFSQNSSDFSFGHAYSLAASGNLRYRVSERFQVQAGYSHTKQTSEHTFIDVRDFDRNLYSFGFVYSFGNNTGVL